MARLSKEEIAAKQARTATERAGAKVQRLKCTLTRANAEFDTANEAFNNEASKVLGALVEDYPESYWTAQARRERAFDKLVEADDAYTAACEQRDAAKEAEIDAVHAAALVELRRQRRRGDMQYHTSA